VILELGALAARCFARGRQAAGDGRPFVVQEAGWTASQGLCCGPDRQQGDVLLAPLHAADMGPVDPHLGGYGVLTDPGRQAQTAQIQSKKPSNIHPRMDGNRALYCHAIYSTLT
jgi:hypothetical protein